MQLFEALVDSARGGAAEFHRMRCAVLDSVELVELVLVTVLYWTV